MMTPIEIQAAVREISVAVGGKGETYVMVSPSGARPATISLYPNGITDSRQHLFVNEETFEEAISAARELWQNYAVKYEAEMVRSMALEIIKITADKGECLDRDLRVGKFDQAAIDRFGARAIEDANQIAANGPFGIKSAGASNAE